MPDPWGERAFCLVTGASRGIGRTIAIEFGRRMGPGSVLLLMARSQQGLEETRTQVLAVSSSVHVELAAVDLASPKDTSTEAFHSAITKVVKGESFPSAILVHNAGTTGGLTHYCSQYNDNVYQDYFQTNLCSTMSLTCAFLRVFPAGGSATITIINMTSLAAVKPLATMGLYCTGKAAREMYFRVLAEENPSIKVLSYSPGPIDTDMFASAVKETVDPGTKKAFMDMAQSKEGARGLLDCNTTVQRLVSILEGNEYKSGDHVAYYEQ